MSASFVFAKVPAFKMDNDRREQFRHLITNLPQETYEELREEMFFDDERQEEIVSSLLDDLEVISTIDSGEVSWETAFSEDGELYELKISGGMTWGESPTEAYDLFWRIAYVDDIFNLALEFAKEDVKTGVERGTV